MNKAKVLVTGGAGYIGSHLIKNLLKEKNDVIALDNLSTGFIEPIEILKKLVLPTGKFEFIRGDLADKNFLAKVFNEHQIDIVIHLAAKIDAAESIKKPEIYHQENFINSINLVEAMSGAGCDKLIFSSTAAVYGEPKYLPIDENHPTLPLSPYGQTKLDFEKYLQKISNLKYLVLRYFNVGGSDIAGLLGRCHLQSCDLIENIFKVALRQSKIFNIFGSNFETTDGTAVRDFVHVEDITRAHILAMKNLENPSADRHSEIFNLGSETGFSVKEVVDKVSLIIGQEIPTEVVEKRSGDIAKSVASSKKAKEILLWQPQYSDLKTILQTDWQWRKRHPLGYDN